jgi:hypothetical protein
MSRRAHRGADDVHGGTCDRDQIESTEAAFAHPAFRRLIYISFISGF